MIDNPCFQPIDVKSETTNCHLIFYNTVIKKYANNERKVKYHSYDNCKGHVSLSRKAKSRESSEYQRYKNLYDSKQKIIDLVYHNGLIKPWEYFLTLTFDPKLIDSRNYEKVSQFLDNWLDNMKHQNKSMQYVIVPEPHKDGKIHFHGIFRNVPNWKLVEARSQKNNRLIKKNGLQIYNLSNYKYGFSTVSQVKDLEAISIYISKYMTKTLIDLSYKKRYWSSKSLQRPEIEYAIFNEDTLNFYLEKHDIKSYKKIENDTKVSIFATLNNDTLM